MQLRCAGYAFAMASPRFLVDAMLGNVARELRLLGLDARLARQEPEARLLRRALAEERLLLTRDRELARRAEKNPSVRVLFMEEEDPKRQTGWVLARLTIDGEAIRPLTRCLECNEPLEEVEREAILARIPPYIGKIHTRFARCPACDRIYWPGTHAERMERRVAHLVQQL